MKRYFKFGSIALAAVLALTIVVSTLAFADTSSDEAAETNPQQTFIAKVAEILNIDEVTVTDAFQQAAQEMMAERQQERLQRAIENGLITEEEAVEIQAWWDSRPEALEGMGPLGEQDQFRERGRMMERFGPRQQPADETE
jgi:hypothetical protein